MIRTKAPFIRMNHRMIRYPTLQILAIVPGFLFLLSMFWLSASRQDGLILFTLFDDAMISMTYARTLAETGNLIWFPGAPLVQGFTNPLWTLMFALVHVAGAQGSSAAFVVSIVGIILVVTTSFIVALTVRSILRENKYGEGCSATAGATIPFLFPLSFWSMRGMEVGLLALLTTALALMVMRQQQGQQTRQWLPFASACTLIGIATRLDFLVLGVSALAITVFFSNDTQQRRAVLVFLGVPLIGLTTIVLTFQYGYYGEWLPNTYTLKVEGFSPIERGLRGSLAAMNTLPTLALVLTGLALTFRASKNLQQRRIVGSFTLLFLSGISYSIWTGGDAWEWSQMANRYESVVLPLAVVIVFVGTALLTSHPSNRVKRIGLVGLISIPLLSVGYGLLTNVSSSFVDFHWRFAALAAAITGGPALAVFIIARLTLTRKRNPKRLFPLFIAVAAFTVATVGGVPIAMWWSTGGPLTQEDAATTEWSTAVAEVTSEEAVVAVVQAGATGYYSRRVMIDLLGKSDPNIASSQPNIVAGNKYFYPGHNKWNYKYSIGKQLPDVVSQLWFPSSGDEVNMSDWGYEWLCFGDGHEAYFLKSSSQVNWSNVRQCPVVMP